MGAAPAARASRSRPASRRCCPYASLFGLRAAVHDGPLDFLDGVGDMDAARARLGAIEDGATAPDTIAVAQDAQALAGGAVAAVEDEAVSVHDGGGADPVAVGPDGGAGAGTG